MNMTLRWYGPGYDSVTLEQIRQIPGVKGVITTLMGKMPGEVWTEEEIAELKKTVEDAGLSIMGIESVNVSDDIKIGTDKRDEHRIILPHWKTWEKRVSIWYATILCRCLTGHVRILPERDRMALRYLHTIRM